MPEQRFDVVIPLSICPRSSTRFSKARKEVVTRFDLKDSKSQIDLNEKGQ